MSLAKETFDRIKKLKEKDLEKFRSFVYSEIDKMDDFTKNIPFNTEQKGNIDSVSKELETYGFKVNITKFNSDDSVINKLQKQGLIVNLVSCEGYLTVSVAHLDGLDEGEK